MPNDLTSVELDQLATLAARFDNEFSHEIEGMLEIWAEQNRTSEDGSINPRGKATPEELLNLAGRFRRAREQTLKFDIGRLPKLLAQLPAGGQAVSLRKTDDGKWEVGWVGGMSGGEYGIRPTFPEAVELLWYEIFEP